MDDETYLARMVERAERIRYHAQHGQVAEALAQISAMPDELSEITVELLKDGARQGMTQRRMAELLDVPPSYVAGIRKAAVA